jgi:transposase
MDSYLARLLEAQGGRQPASVSLSDATLKAVQAHGEGATANEVMNYLSREFGMTVRPNHLGLALQRHRRAGNLKIAISAGMHARAPRLQRRMIAERYAKGETMAALASEFGVGEATVWRALRGKEAA